MDITFPEFTQTDEPDHVAEPALSLPPSPGDIGEEFASVRPVQDATP